MKKAIIISLIVILCMSQSVFAGSTLDEVLNSPEINEEQGFETEGSTPSSRNPVYNENKGFIDGIKNAGDLSADIEGAAIVTDSVKQVVAFIVQILAYSITILLALRVALDIMFISLPFARTMLGNGHQGNAQAGAGGGMVGMGGMSGGMGGGMGGQGNMALSNQQQASSSSKIQWVSNAALNSVEGEKTVGPDGKSVSPFNLYMKDMIIVLILVPVLLTLAVTGALTNIGFIAAQVLVNTLAKIGNML